MQNNILQSKLMVLSILCVFIGNAIFVFSIMAKMQSSNTAEWKEGKALIIYSEAMPNLAKATSYFDEIDDLSWLFTVSYQYEFDGKTYQSTKFSNTAEVGVFHQDDLTTFAKMPNQLAHLASDYAKGNTVPVFINPNMPELSYLVYHDSNRTILISIAFGFVFAFLGWVFFRMHLKD